MNRFVKVIFFVCLCWTIINVSRGQVAVSSDITGSVISKKEEKALDTFYFLSGVKSYLSGDHNGAKDLFDHLIKSTNSTHAPALYYRARVAIDERNVDQAKQLLKVALELDPKNIDYLSEYARLAVNMNMVEEAYQAYKLLAKLDSTSKEYKVFLPTLTYLSGNKEQAMDLINAFEAENSFNTRLSAIKREYLIDNQLFDSLENYTNKLLEADPGDVETLINAAQVNAAKGRDSIAQVYYKNAIDVGRGDMGPYIALADFYRIRRNISNWCGALKPILNSQEINVQYKIEQFLELIRAVGKERIKAGELDSIAKIMIESETNEQGVDVEVAKLYLEFLFFKEDFVDALSYCDVLFEKMQLPPDLNKVYLQLLYQNKREKTAREVGSKLVVKEPKDVDLAILVAYLHTQEGGDRKKAIELFNFAVKNATTDSLKSVAHGARGDYYYELKKPKNYYADYNTALKFDPNNALVLNNLAYFMALDGKDLSQALLYAKKANELSDRNPTYLDTQAWVNYLMGRYDEAKRLMLLVMAYDRNPSSDVLIHYGDILYALGEDYMARENWNKALNAGADKKDIDRRLAQPKAVK